jgi:hypothetical protein
MENEKERLSSAIVEKMGWGPVAGWQGGDFRRLNQFIFDKTRVNISESTLRRVLGKADYPHLPSETTLNTLSMFLGYENWRDFKTKSALPSQAVPRLFPWQNVISLTAIVLLVLVAGVFYLHRHSDERAFNYAFSSRPVTRTIPNSVIFNYDVGNTTKPVYVQQSWDRNTRVKVAATGHTLASVYYRPGFYQAKLIVGDRIVKQHPLLIPTDGWLGLIYQKPVPDYLRPDEFTKPGRLEIAPSVFTAHHINLEPAPLRAELYNVGNFMPVGADKVEFSAQIRCDYTTGAGACGRAVAFLVTNAIPISIPVCARGCVAALDFANGTGLVSGKNTDLSGFGVDAGSWVNVSIKTSSGKLQLLVNNKVAYQAPLSPAGLKILGIAFGFYGGGEARHITLADDKKVVFSAF